MDATFTLHASQRFAERFPGEHMGHAAKRAAHVPTQKLIHEVTQAGSRTKVVREAWQAYYRDEVTGALFVVVASGGRLVCVTVWRFPRPDKAVREKRGRQPRKSRHPAHELEECEW